MASPDCNPLSALPASHRTKAEIRADVIARRAAIPTQLRRRAAEDLARLPGDARFSAFLPANGAVIAGYLPIRDEIDPRPLMAKLAQSGYRLALPRMRNETLDFALFTSEDALVPGRFNTREPSVEAPIVTPALILTPLVAFDGANQRLGYGKGFYDRAFAAAPGARRIGLAFALQRVEALPHEPHDAPLDAVFTEVG